MLQNDSTGILRRLLKFPPVEDVHILVSMGVAFKDRIVGGAGPAPLVPKKPEPAREPLREPLREPEVSREPPKQDIDPLANPLAKSTSAPSTKPISASPDTLPDPLGGPTKAPAKEPCEQELPGEPKSLLTEVPKSNNPMLEKVNIVVNLLKQQTATNKLDELKMLKALDTLNLLKDDIVREMAKKQVSSVPNPLRRV